MTSPEKPEKATVGGRPCLVTAKFCSNPMEKGVQSVKQDDPVEEKRQLTQYSGTKTKACGQFIMITVPGERSQLPASKWLVLSACDRIEASIV